MDTIKKIFSKLLVFVVLLNILSCASRREVVYFQDAKSFETVVNTESFTPRLKIDDLLSIHVSAFDAESVRPFNLTKGMSEAGRVEELDFLIDKDGFIDYPLVGKIKLIGLTIEEAKAEMVNKLKDYLKDPIINIRIKNFRVTVLGEVNRPGTYTINSERISITEALGLAGDLRIKGRRDNVLVVRDFNGAKTYTRINLTSKEFINSPVYYLTQNDLVYVEPNQSAITSSSLDNRATITISIISTLLTSAIILITRN